MTPIENKKKSLAILKHQLTILDAIYNKKKK